ncbi:transposable element Tcb2 transposase [Elysia marginata]|uniref:Transposable element Tcb2 transposase n=1 Tax=Elysia marginata TaxID=1093978 RepID=A0AAV4F1B2_9GAST|nr:transposable element Tcb2 transposase [Elysia marginata]
MPRLSEVDRHRALGLLQAGLPISEVSLRMNVNRTTIFRLRQRLHETDAVSDRPRSGRPGCTTQRQDRNLVRNHMNNRFLSASASSCRTRAKNNQRISANTVKRRLSTSSPIHRPHPDPASPTPMYAMDPGTCRVGSHPMAKCRIQLRISILH